jgi:hypothetical protein
VKLSIGPRDDSSEKHGKDGERPMSADPLDKANGTLATKLIGFQNRNARVVPCLLGAHLLHLFNEVGDGIELLAGVLLVVLDRPDFRHEFAQQQIGPAGAFTEALANVTGGHGYARPCAKGGG